MKNLLLKNVFHATTSEYHRRLSFNVVTVQKLHFLQVVQAYMTKVFQLATGLKKHFFLHIQRKRLHGYNEYHTPYLQTFFKFHTCSRYFVGLYCRRSKANDLAVKDREPSLHSDTTAVTRLGL